MNDLLHPAMLIPGDDGFPDWAEGYVAVRKLDDGQWLALYPMLYTSRVGVCDPTSVLEFWEFERGKELHAKIAFSVWPEMWVPLACEWVRHCRIGEPIERQYKTTFQTGDEFS